ncbi:MAG: TIR domain-containing protein [Prevotellaceae bacterium]|jgi:hypothetical protein|nr:TIR domain-containing protein [Prevotellaceae bacterium]
MSIQSITNSITTLDREIHNIESQIQTANNNISRKEKEANAILDKINKEKDLKRIITFQKDLTRKNEELNRLNKDKSVKTKNLSEKQTKRIKFTQDLSKEEQKERDKVKKEQKEMLSLQQSITREMERQRILATNSLVSLGREQREDMAVKKIYDVFVSHASEDKATFVKPFVELLKEKGISVWYDELELQIGDSLRRSIDNGLKNSRYGIVVLSEAFFRKQWTQRELNGLFAREDGVILPIWHKISKDEVMQYSPIIADLKALNTSDFTKEEIAEQIAAKINR